MQGGVVGLDIEGLEPLDHAWVWVAEGIVQAARDQRGMGGDTAQKRF